MFEETIYVRHTAQHQLHWRQTCVRFVCYIPDITIRYMTNFLNQSRLITLLPSLIAPRWVGRQTRWWPRHKAIYFSWLGPELFCLLRGPSGFNCWFSVVLVDTLGISRCRSQHVSVESSSLFHHSIYLWFICLPWWSIDELENLHADRTTVCFEPW